MNTRAYIHRTIGHANNEVRELYHDEKIDTGDADPGEGNFTGLITGARTADLNFTAKGTGSVWFDDIRDLFSLQVWLKKSDLKLRVQGPTSQVSNYSSAGIFHGDRHCSAISSAKN